MSTVKHLKESTTRVESVCVIHLNCDFVRIDSDDIGEGEIGRAICNPRLPRGWPAPTRSPARLPAAAAKEPRARPGPSRRRAASAASARKSLSLSSLAGLELERRCSPGPSEPSEPFKRNDVLLYLCNI